MLSLYLYYTKAGKPLAPSLALLFQYGVAASCNYALARLILILPQKLLDTSYSVDSAHYTMAALLSAWLLSQLCKVFRNVSVELEFTRLHGGGGKQGTGKTGEESHDEETGKP